MLWREATRPLCQQVGLAGLELAALLLATSTS